MKNIITKYNKFNESILGDVLRLNPKRKESDTKGLKLIDEIVEDFNKYDNDLRKVYLSDGGGNIISFSRIEIGKSYTLKYVFGEFHPVIRNTRTGNRESGDRRIEMVGVPYAFSFIRNELEALFNTKRLLIGKVRVSDIKTIDNLYRNPNIGNHARFIEKENEYTISTDIGNILLNYFTEWFNYKYPQLKNTTVKSSSHIKELEMGIPPIIKFGSIINNRGEMIDYNVRLGDDERKVRKMIYNMSKDEFDNYFKKREGDINDLYDKAHKEYRSAIEKDIKKILDDNNIDLTKYNKNYKNGFYISGISEGYNFTLQFRHEKDISDDIKKAFIGKKINNIYSMGETFDVEKGIKDDKHLYYSIKFSK